jgi:hypothetical protein
MELKNYRVEIKWALIFAAVTLLWLLLERLFGFHSTRIDQHVMVSSFFAIPAIVVYVFAFLEKRKKSYDGKMTYKQGLIFGLILTGIITVLVPITQSIISYVITPEYFTNAINHAVGEGLRTQEAAEAYFNLKNYIIEGMIGTPIMGVVTSAVVAIFTRKK